MTTTADTAARDALVERLFQATIGTLELFSVHLGWRLGLYRALAEGGPSTADELAARAGIDARYAREWLEQQAAAGFLTVSAEGAFAVPPAYAEVFADPESAAHVAPFAPMVVGIAGALPEVVEAYRTGGGVPYERYGPDFRDGQGAINRPAFVHELAGWVEAMPDVHARLQADPPARVADVAGGQGQPTVALARAYPRARVEGVDLDEASVADARRVAEQAGVDVAFAVRSADDLAAEGGYDLVCVFEALHDMAHPVEALAAMRRALSPGGSVLVADERVGESFSAPADEVERMMYGWSVVHCLPASRTDEGSAALGTVLRVDTVRRLAAEAGFGAVDVLPVENDFFRFYRLRP
jgi:SAM-dependent methyltransferase